MGWIAIDLSVWQDNFLRYPRASFRRLLDTLRVFRVNQLLVKLPARWRRRRFLASIVAAVLVSFVAIHGIIRNVMHSASPHWLKYPM